MHTKRSGLFVIAAAAALLALLVPASARTAQAVATVTVTAGKPSEFAFRLSKTTVPVGVVNFRVVNAGMIVHDFKIAGKKTRVLNPGESQTIQVRFGKAGSFAYVCTVSGHAAAGMKGVLRVGPAAPAAVRLVSTLNVRQQVPRPKGTLAGASGRFTATLTGQSLRWQLTFKRLSSRAIAARLHVAPRGKIGRAAKTLCAPCTTPRRGTLKLTAAQAAAIRNGRVYVAVATAKNPRGEIRGQVARASAT